MCPTTRSNAVLGLLFFALVQFAPTARANNSVHLADHWHLHQPIYWPDYVPGLNRYQFGANSVDLKFANQNIYPGDPFKHPRNALADEGGEFDQVFTKADRIGAYQNVGKDSIATLLGHPDAGASVSYSGALQENIWSFGKDNRYGYGPGWNSGFTTARGWTTSGGKPRGDMLGMTYPSRVFTVAAEECAAKGDSNLQRDLVEVVERQSEQVRSLERILAGRSGVFGDNDSGVGERRLQLGHHRQLAPRPHLSELHERRPARHERLEH